MSDDPFVADPLEMLVGTPGANSARFLDGRINPGRPVTLLSARPQDYEPDIPVLFAHHGASRNAETLRDHWLAFAEDAGWLVIVPDFSKEHYPGVGWYNDGNILDEAGRLNPSEQWIFGFDRDLFHALRDAGITRRPRYCLFGHSAGAQFVHRMLTLIGTDGVEAAVAANAGRYTLPLTDEDFPFGVQGLGVDDRRIADYFAFPLQIHVGEHDVETTMKNFPRDPDAMRQGPHRRARAGFYFDTCKALAAQMGVPFNWDLTVVPDAAHDADHMSHAAGPALAALITG